MTVSRPTLAATAAAVLVLTAAGSVSAKELNTATDWDRTSSVRITTTATHAQGSRVSGVEPGQTFTLSTAVDRQQSVWNAYGTNFDRFGLTRQLTGRYPHDGRASVRDEGQQRCRGQPGLGVRHPVEATGFLGPDVTRANPLDTSGRNATCAGGSLRSSVTVAHDGPWTGS